MENAKPKIIIVVGPTASGKSDLAIAIAKKFNGEIISADSRQIYRKLDIGTAKTMPEQMKGVTHHLIDICDIQEKYTAADFKRDAANAITAILNRGKTPIIAGGTFFYIDALLDRVSTPNVPPDEALRTELETYDVDTLYTKLATLDPNRASDIDKKNKRRLIRAIEIVHALGSVPAPTKKESAYDALILGIETPKEVLRERYTKRAQQWLRNGFLAEVQMLVDEKVGKQRLQELGFEYQLGLQLLEGTLTETQFKESFVQKNWQYAKRQLTWLKRDRSIHWISLAEQGETDIVIEQFLMN